MNQLKRGTSPFTWTIIHVLLAKLPYRNMTEAEQEAHRQRMIELYGYREQVKQQRKCTNLPVRQRQTRQRAPIMPPANPSRRGNARRRSPIRTSTAYRRSTITVSRRRGREKPNHANVTDKKHRSVCATVPHTAPYLFMMLHRARLLLT